MTRDQIIGAAAQIFGQKGFHATSMQDIAEAVHLQKASIYHHVSSKQEILYAVLNQSIDELSKRILDVIRQPYLPAEKLHKAICVYMNTLLDNQHLAYVLLLEHRSLEPKYLSSHIPRRDYLENLWREMIIEGVNEGFFNCLNVAVASRALLGTMNWSIIWYRQDGTLTPAEVADQFANLFLDGLLVR